MKKATIYAFLEETFLSYRDLARQKSHDNGEPMVNLKETGIRTNPIDPRMEHFTPGAIYVRAAVAERLEAVQKTLMAARLHLEVIYGYRHLLIQTEAYQEVRQQLLKENTYRDEDSLREAVHRFIAVPEVSGHPTGGAVDVRLLDASGTPLDMGTKPHDFIKDSYSFSPFINPQAWINRQKLRFYMNQAGFVPFDGEWWHFSYGDREWAAYTNAPTAIYEPLSFRTLS